MWYKNIAVRFFGLVTKHACDRRTDGQTDRITTPKTNSGLLFGHDNQHWQPARTAVYLAFPLTAPIGAI